METAESAYAAELLPVELRGTGFGTLAVVNGVGDTASSIAVGVLWTAVAPQAGFAYGAVFSLVAVLALATFVRSPGAGPSGHDN